MKKITTSIILLFALFFVPAAARAAELLIPGGQLIGLSVENGKVTVAAFDEALGEAARTAGLQIGDHITRLNDRDIHSAEDVRQALDRSDGRVTLSVLRQGTAKKLTLHPEITDEGPRLGVYLKEGINGVGTVSWYDPEKGIFGALGHGINEKDGSLLQMERGQIFDAAVVSVRKGKAGTPGQLMGAPEDLIPLGDLQKNTVQGIFGKADSLLTGQPLPVGKSHEVHTGPAVIRSTVCGEGLREYSVELVKIYPNSGAAGRNMLVKVTDPALLETTGGIVQGMSGSPIIQDGKLIGAVTHVLVNDPTTGYGIFIENMLDAAA